MKQKLYLALAAVMMVALVLAGCSSSQPPKAALEAAMKKTMEAKSYKLSMTMQVDELDLGDAASMQATGITPDVTGLIKDATIKVDAVYEKEPLRTDMNLAITLPGMMDMKLELPIIVTEKEMYLKLPNIPLLQLPEEVTGKFVKLDMEELAQESGAGASLDMAAQQKLSGELSAAVLKHFDEKTYFSQLKAADAGLPEGFKADKVVKFAITSDNYAATVDTIVNQVVPEVLDVLIANEAYLASINADKAELEEAKQNYESGKAELKKVLTEQLKITELELVGAIKDGYVGYQKGKFGVQISDPELGEDMKLGLSFSAQYSDFNKEAQFEQELPTDTISFDELMATFMGAGGL